MGNLCGGGEKPKGSKGGGSAKKADSALEIMLAGKVKAYIEAHHMKSAKSLNQVIMKFPQILKAFEEIRSIFNDIDSDKNGSIERSEFHAACEKMKCNADEALINNIYDEADMNQDQHVSFKEFIIMITIMFFMTDMKNTGNEATVINNAIEKVLEAFLFFDKDGDGFIEKAEVMRVMNESTPSRGAGAGGLTAARFQEMDWDHNERVSFKEFLFAVESWVGLEDEEDE